MEGIRSSLPNVKTAALTWLGASNAMSNVNCKNFFMFFEISVYITLNWIRFKCKNDKHKSLL
jgi:hypothetical protein